MHAETVIEKEQPKKVALIFGASGQDGTYLTEFLLSKDYEVHGVSRKNGSVQGDGICGDNHLFLHIGDISDSSSVLKLVQSIKPDEIYNLAAQSAVKTSFDLPLETAEINAIGTLHILESIKLLQSEKNIKFFQAASSELFGSSKESSQNEKTLFYPRSPYAVSKLYSYWITTNYREAYGIFGCNGILFNHESPIRPESFITRKITLGACRYKLGAQEILYLGNLNAKRDWGYAKDYVEAMWLMLQQERPDDFVIATGETHSVRECVETAFKEVGVDIEWHEEGINEYGTDKNTGKIIVKVDPNYFRPCEVTCSLGNSAKANIILNWKPKTSFQELIKIMITSDYEKEKARLLKAK
ncbi:MAG: GDP-mannose 4,6-dehydratase [Parachlamydiaceae bacterium]|nr:GDP-mannose 4,6-dehydratase [Parachlamydiaceae bacterium]